ncbi:MAG: hypothetical protein ACP5OA_00015 [Candidatus Woesearchaeota archaeon]
MRVAASVYNCESHKALAIYNEYPDIYSALPKPMAGNHLMHVEYSYSNKRASFDVYLLKGKIDATNLNIKKNFSSRNHEDLKSEEVFQDHNVVIESKKGIRFSELERNLHHLIALDIHTFCRKNANEKCYSGVRCFDSIVPFTNVRYIEPKFLLKPGKSEFVPSCLLQANLYFSKGCITGFVPSEGAFFRDKVFQGFYHDKLAECDYCYALDKHDVYPKTFVKINKKKLREELEGKFEDFNNNIVGQKVKILRLGKRTEAGAVYNSPQLIDSLETCIDANIEGIIFPTKFLEYDSELAKLLKRSNTQLLYSMGFDNLEHGAYFHNMSNAQRLENAIKYHEAGVKSAPYLMLDLTSSLSIGDKGLIDKVLNHGMSIQLLGARVPKKDLAVRMTGRSWENLKQHPDQHTMNGERVGGYILTGNTTLTPEKIHPEILRLISDNNGRVRLCHHNTHTTWCGACFMREGFTTETEQPNLTPIKKYKRKPKEFTGKLDLDFD